MSAAVELARSFEAGGWTIPAPLAHPIGGVAAHAWIDAAHLVAAARSLNDAGFFYESMTCIDRIDPHGAFELLYTFNRFDVFERIALRAWIPKDAPAPSLTGVYPIAGWNEREAWEFYGLSFDGHPDLTWLLLPDDTDFRPLLKSFTAPPPSEYDDSMSAPAGETS